MASMAPKYASAQPGEPGATWVAGFGWAKPAGSGAGSAPTSTDAYGNPTGAGYVKTASGWQQQGSTSPSDAGAAERQFKEASRTNEQNQLSAELAQMLRNSNNLASQSSSTGAGTKAAQGSPVGAAVAPPVGQAQAGMDAALLRAKEKQGQIARSALTGLREALGERQMLGSGAEAQATGDVTQAALGSLSDVNREQLIQGDENARRLAELGYQGSIQQRGQDITARGQDIQAALGDANIGNAQATSYFNQQQALLDALKSLAY